MVVVFKFDSSKTMKISPIILSIFAIVVCLQGNSGSPVQTPQKIVFEGLNTLKKVSVSIILLLTYYNL